MKYYGLFLYISFSLCMDAPLDKVNTLFNTSAGSLMAAHRTTYGKKEIAESDYVLWDTAEKQIIRTLKAVDRQDVLRMNNLLLILNSYKFILERRQKYLREVFSDSEDTKSSEVPKGQEILCSLFSKIINEIEEADFEKVDTFILNRIAENISLVTSGGGEYQQLKILRGLGLQCIAAANYFLEKEISLSAREFLELCENIKLHKVDFDKSQRIQITPERLQVWARLREMEQKEKEKNKCKIKSKVKGKKKIRSKRGK